MTSTLKVSRFLSRHLDCRYDIGSEKIVFVRRFMKCLCEKIGNHSFIFTGSKSDGLDFISSDEDVMIIENGVIAVQPHDEIRERDISKTIVVMDNTDCRPGYIVLRLHQVGAIQRGSVMDAMIDFNGSKYFSSDLFISNILLRGSYRHGPCSAVTDEDAFDVDYACSFHCRSWPHDLSDFSNRTKYCVWPSRHLVNYIVKGGCHVVAIGDKHARLSPIQWRISFALAEKSLVLSFNHVQLKTYALLKIFLKECIERHQSINELLCSYFMKTIVFHAIEHSRASMWVDENIVQCFWYCFTILLECVQTGYLPNYFVLANNMFLSKVTGDNRRRLLRVLSRYQCMGYTCLFQCPSLQSLPIMIQQSHSMYPLAGEHEDHEIYHDLYIYSNIRFHIDPSANSAHIIELINKLFLRYSEDDNLLDIGLLYLSQVIASISSNSIADLIQVKSNSNKLVYRQIRRHKGLLQVLSATDVCNGMLSLATFYYNVGCYNKVSDVAIRVVFACQQKGLLQEFGGTKEYFEEMCGKGYTLLQKAKRSFVFSYMIHKTNCKLYPPELHKEVQTNERLFYVPPLPYALFLVVLSTFRLGNIVQSQTIIEDLMAVQTNPIYDVRDYPILDNLVGICHQLLGNTRQVIESSEESCRRLPDNPAALIRIADLSLTRREQKGEIGIERLGYCNVRCLNQCNDNNNDDDGNKDVFCFHKTMYNIDPVDFINLSWF